MNSQIMSEETSTSQVSPRCCNEPYLFCFLCSVLFKAQVLSKGVFHGVLGFVGTFGSSSDDGWDWVVIVTGRLKSARATE